jgi:hypothetical protein
MAESPPRRDGESRPETAQPPANPTVFAGNPAMIMESTPPGSRVIAETIPDTSASSMPPTGRPSFAWFQRRPRLPVRRGPDGRVRRGRPGPCPWRDPGSGDAREPGCMGCEGVRVSRPRGVRLVLCESTGWEHACHPAGTRSFLSSGVIDERWSTGSFPPLEGRWPEGRRGRSPAETDWSVGRPVEAVTSALGRPPSRCRRTPPFGEKRTPALGCHQRALAEGTSQLLVGGQAWIVAEHERLPS